MRINPLQRHWPLLVVLAAFAAVIAPSLGDGVGSWDAHDILGAVRALTERHVIELSRPPGHPTTDFFLLGSIAWCLRSAAGLAFTERSYLIVALVASLGAATLFYAWLVRQGRTPWHAGLAVVCLAFSPQFLAQTLDGEEFIVGMVFVLLALIALRPPAHARPRLRRLVLSLVCFAFATGCRPEFLLLGLVIYPLHFWLWSIRDRRTWLAAAAVAIGAGLVVWWPVLQSRGFAPAQPVGMTVGQRLLGGGYKLLFQCFSFPLSLAWFGLLAAAVAGVWSRRQRPFTPADFPDLAALLVGGLFTGVFFFRPHKPAYVLIVVPFLIWLATRHRPRICGGLALLTVVSGFVSIDIFRNRMPVSPHWVEGSYRQAIQGKPAARRAYLERLLVLPRADHTVLIGAAWSWDYDFHLTRGTFPLHRVSRISQREAAYAMNTTPDRLLVPRDAIERPGQLARWREKGYTVLVDRQLWRMVFARYRLADTPGDQATVGGVPVHLIDVPDRS